jgi:hypothetical protein
VGSAEIVFRGLCAECVAERAISADGNPTRQADRTLAVSTNGPSRQ